MDLPHLDRWIVKKESRPRVLGLVSSIKDSTASFVN